MYSFKQICQLGCQGERMGLAVFTLYAFGALVLVKTITNSTASESSFYVNNRSSSAAMVAFSIVASCVGASATIGTVGLAFTAGTPAFWWLGSGAVGLSVLTVLLARRVRSSNAYTLPEIVEKCLGAQGRRLISAIIVIAWISILAAQFRAITQIIQALTGLTPLISLLSGALLIAAQTFINGQSGIIKLDRIQCFIMLGGFLLLAFWLMHSSTASLGEIKWEATNEHFPASYLLYFLLVQGGSYVVCPMLFGRLLSAESEKAAQWGAFWAILGLCFFSVLIVLIGLLSKGLIPADSQPDHVLTTLLATVLPAWLTYIVYLTFLSVIISSADSCLITASLILAGDLWQQKSVRCTRLCVVILALAGILLTFMDKTILGFLMMANSIYVCGVVAPVFITILAGEARKASPFIMMAGLISGGILGLLSSITEQHSLSYLGVIVSSLLVILSFMLFKNHHASNGG